MRNSYFRNYSILALALFLIASVSSVSSLSLAQNKAHTKAWRLLKVEILSGGLKMNCKRGFVVESEAPPRTFSAETGFANAPCTSNADGANATLKVGMSHESGQQYRAHLSLSTVTLESQVASMSPAAALTLKNILGGSSQSDDRYFQWMAALAHGTQRTGWMDRTYSMVKTLDVKCATFRPTFAGVEIPSGWPGSNRIMECIGGQYTDEVGVRPEVVLSFEEINL